MQTILHINNPHVEAFRNAGASLTQLLNNHFVSNYTVSDVQVRSDLDPAVLSISIDPIAPEDPEQGLPAIVFDASENVIQHLTNSNYHNLRSEQPNLFPAPVVEPAPEPRYQTTNIDPRHFMEMFQNLRKDGSGKGEDVLASITLLAKQMEDDGDPTLRVWLAKEGAGPIDINHPEVVYGLDAMVQLGRITQAESDEISKGLLIE